jgi:hypothetical protein
LVYSFCVIFKLDTSNIQNSREVNGRERVKLNKWA